MKNNWEIIYLALYVIETICRGENEITQLLIEMRQTHQKQI